MRYVFFAFACLAMVIAWMNLTPNGERAKSHLLSGEQSAAYQ